MIITAIPVWLQYIRNAAVTLVPFLGHPLSSISSQEPIYLPFTKWGSHWRGSSQAKGWDQAFCSVFFSMLGPKNRAETSECFPFRASRRSEKLEEIIFGVGVMELRDCSRDCLSSIVLLSPLAGTPTVPEGPPILSQGAN